MKSLSIIVPCYNVEDYVKECLDSLLEISYFDYEIIVINDGSTDRTFEILQDYENNDKIKVLTQNNKGLSATRNRGLRESKGDYVFFCDSDDWIDAKVFSSILSLYLSCNYDIIIGNFYDALSESSYSLNKYKFGENLIDTGANIFNEFYIDRITSVVWRNIFSREFLLNNNIVFMEGVYFEDVEFMPNVLLKANSVICISEIFYFYRLRQGSIINSDFNRKKFEDALSVSMKLLKMDTSDNKSKQTIEKIVFFLFTFSITRYNGALTSSDKLKLDSIFKSFNCLSFKNKLVIRLFRINTKFLRFVANKAYLIKYKKLR